MMDLSHVRSLTVFGKWRPFFMSAKMCLLQVLDLENTKGLLDHHLKEIGKFLHLKYLSLRGCEDIFHLPDSLGNLKQLQTLDVKNTNITKLPNTTIKLMKLQYIYAGTETYVRYEEFYGDMPLLRTKIFILFICSVWFCAQCCTPQAIDEDVTMNRRDICTKYFCNYFPSLLRKQRGYGVALPRGLRKLRALHKLSTVDISVGKHILKDIKSLTQLRRLGVTGINKKNCQEFCSTLDHLNSLESLSVHSAAEPGLCGCLDGMSSPSKNLQSLKLAGRLVKLPEWIEGLHNVVKLKLEKTKISELDATIHVLGKLPNLAMLRLFDDPFEGEDLRLTFHRESFPSLMALLLFIRGLKSVEFEEEATPKLERLCFAAYPRDVSVQMFSGLPSLPSFKEFLLDNDDNYSEDFVKNVQDQLAENPNAPVLKRWVMHSF